LYQERLQEIEALRRRLTEVESALSAAHSTIDQQNLRINVLTEDLQRLKDALNNQVAENDKLRRRIDELSPLVAENESLQHRVILITQENERITRLYQERLAEIEALRHKLAEYENLKRMYNACVDENKRLQTVINDRVADIQRLYQKLHEHHNNEAASAEQLYNNMRNSTNFSNFNKLSE
jgi:predicted nuclease with TOPRIM domain